MLRYIEAIQRRNEFLKFERTRALFSKIAKGRQARHLIRHPLSSLKERIEANDLIFTDDQGNEVHFGAHFHGNGKSLVKGENIAFHTRIVDGKEVIEEYRVTGLGHGTPIHATSDEPLGVAGPYMLEAGISSTLCIAEFWGLIGASGKGRARSSIGVERSQLHMSTTAVQDVVHGQVGQQAVNGAGALERTITSALRAGGILK